MLARLDCLLRSRMLAQAREMPIAAPAVRLSGAALLWSRALQSTRSARFSVRPARRGRARRLGGAFGQVCGLAEVARGCGLLWFLSRGPRLSWVNRHLQSLFHF